MNKLGKGLLLAAIISGVVFAVPEKSKAITTVDEIEQLKNLNYTVTDPAKGFDTNHWAYKSLERISKKYGLLIGSPNEKFDGTKPLTRNEAAVLLVNLVGKIDESRLEMTEYEKGQLEILKQELSAETQKLAGRVDKLEDSVDSLKGSVTKLETDDKLSIKHKFGEDFKLGGLLQARYTSNISKGADIATNASNFTLPIVELNVSGKFHKNIHYLASMFPQRQYNTASGLVGDVYVMVDKVPNHKFIIGQTRVPIGQEGAQGFSTMDTVVKSQASRNLSDYRDIGMKIHGSYKPLEYFVGVYNGSGENRGDVSNSDMDYGGWVNFKPLYKYPKLGTFDVGGGYYTGKKTFDHNTYGFYSRYAYKKYAIQAEYLNKDGYLADGRRADGFYVHNTYFLTKKLQLVARYDVFDPNKRVSNNLNSEYTLGANYYMKNNALKFQFDYVHVNNQAGKDSDRIYVNSQYLF